MEKEQLLSMHKIISLSKVIQLVLLKVYTVWQHGGDELKDLSGPGHTYSRENYTKRNIYLALAP